MNKLRQSVDTELGQPMPWLASFALWSARVLVLGLLIYAPWFYGMVTWGQQFLLLPWISAIIGLTWVYAFCRPQSSVRSSPLLLSLCLLLVIALLQVTPLPGLVFEALAPSARFERAAVEKAAAYLSVDPDDAELQHAAKESGPLFQTLSIHPLQTRASLVGFSAAIAMLVCASVLFRDRTGRTLLLLVLSSISTVIATLGILQNISWTQWSLLGSVSTVGFGTFVSRNSAPQYLAIGLGSTIAFGMAWLARKRKAARHDQRYRATTWYSRIRHSIEDSVKELDTVIILIALAFVLQMGGVIGSASRGGLVSMIFAMLVTLLLTIGRSRKVQVTGIIGIGIVATLVLFFVSSFELDEQIAARLEMDRLESPVRVEFWKMALGQSEYWWTGCGLGTFHFGIMLANTQQPYWIYHAESIFVEMASEFGLPGAVIGLLGLSWLCFQLFSRRESRTVSMWPAALYSTCAVGLHSSVDFSLIIPAIFLSLAALLGAYLGEISSTERERPNRLRTNALKARTSISLFALGLLVVLWQGAGPLIGFAQAERIENENWLDRAESSLVNRILPQTYDLSHPEVVLQLSRQRITATEAYIMAQDYWPFDRSKTISDSTSRMEFIASIMRSPNPDRWQGLNQQMLDDEQLIESLNSTHAGFVYMSRFCPLDWRGHWGIYQTSASINSTFHALTCARLQAVTYSMPRLQQAVGTCEVLADNRTVGLDYWRYSLFFHPDQTNRLAALMGANVDMQELEQVIPSAQIPRAYLARALVERRETEVLGNQLLEQLDLSRLESEAGDERDWNVVVWVTQKRGETLAYIEALRMVANLRPMDKTIRIKLAEALESVGRIDEAIQQIEQASRRTVLGPSDEALLQRLRRSKTPPL